MARQVGYVFADEKGLDDAKLASRIVLGVDQTGNGTFSGPTRTGFAKVVALRAGKNNKQATASEVVYNATTQLFEAPTTPLIFDSDTATADSNTTDIFSSEEMEVGKEYKIIPYGDSSEAEQWMVVQSGAGTSLVWLTTDNTGLGFNDGAKYDRPGGTGAALTATDVYYVATPWNTRIVAPNSYFGYFVQAGTDWYHHVEQFYVKCTAAYPAGAGAGITAFTCYLNKSDTSLNIGTNAAFPAGIKCIQKGFDNVNAGTNSLNYFNGATFPASFDTAANIIYLDHPSF